MKLHAQDVRRPAGAFAVVAIAAGLALTGCAKSSGTGSTAAATTAGAGASTSAASSAAASNSASSSAVTVSTGSAPFPTTVGDSWTYKNSNGDTSVNKIVSSTAVAAGQQVAMATALKSTDGTTTNDTFDYIVQPNGQISLPTSQFTSSLANTGASVKITSGGIFWPSAAQLASGQALHTTLTMTIKVGGTTEKIVEHVTSTGEGTQTVTVPAGTYSASVINVQESADMMGYSTTIDDKTWLAPGVGPVQSELISVDGSKTDIANKQELVSFTKG
jgi:hypothetical protein